MHSRTDKPLNTQKQVLGREAVDVQGHVCEGKLLGRNSTNGGLMGLQGHNERYTNRSRACEAALS